MSDGSEAVISFPGRGPVSGQGGNSDQYPHELVKTNNQSINRAAGLLASLNHELPLEFPGLRDYITAALPAGALELTPLQLTTGVPAPSPLVLADLHRIREAANALDGGQDFISGQTVRDIAILGNYGVEAKSKYNSFDKYSANKLMADIAAEKRFKDYIQYFVHPTLGHHCLHLAKQQLVLHEHQNQLVACEKFLGNLHGELVANFQGVNGQPASIASNQEHLNRWASSLESSFSTIVSDIVEKFLLHSGIDQDWITAVSSHVGSIEAIVSQLRQDVRAIKNKNSGLRL